MSETLLTGGGEAEAPVEGGAPPTGMPEAAPAPEVSADHIRPSGQTEGRFLLSQYEGEDWARDPSITRFADEDGAVDVATLAKSYSHAQSLMGKDRITVPESEDDWGEVYDQLGRPADPSAYEFEKPELPEGVDANYSEDMERDFREKAYGLGLSQRQAKEAYQAIIAQRLEEIGQVQKDAAREHEEGLAVLRREQGDNFDAYLAEAKAGIRAFASPEYVEHLERTGEGNNPQVIRMWAKVGREMRGDQRLEGATSQATPADIQGEIDAYIDKHGAAVDNPDHPDFQRHRQHLNRLYTRLYPEAV